MNHKFNFQQQLIIRGGAVFLILFGLATGYGLLEIQQQAAIFRMIFFSLTGVLLFFYKRSGFYLLLVSLLMTFLLMPQIKPALILGILIIILYLWRFRIMFD